MHNNLKNAGQLLNYPVFTLKNWQIPRNLPIEKRKLKWGGAFKNIGEFKQWQLYFFQQVARSALNLPYSDDGATPNLRAFTSTQRKVAFRSFKKQFTNFVKRFDSRSRVSLEDLYAELKIVIARKELSIDEPAFLDLVTAEAKPEKKRSGNVGWPLILRLEIVRAIVLTEREKEKKVWVDDTLRKGGELHQWWMATYPLLPFPWKLPTLKESGDPNISTRLNHVADDFLTSIFKERNSWKFPKLVPENDRTKLVQRLRTEAIPHLKVTSSERSFLDAAYKSMTAPMVRAKTKR